MVAKIDWLICQASTWLVLATMVTFAASLAICVFELKRTTTTIITAVTVVISGVSYHKLTGGARQTAIAVTLSAMSFTLTAIYAIHRHHGT